MQNQAWSQLLATYNVADELWAKAYEITSAKERACLKNAIAFHALAGEEPSCEHIKRSHLNMGYELNILTKPAPWALYICDESYSSPARLVAALMPAINAQVQQIYVIFTHEHPAPALLTALELLGIEEAIAIAKQEAHGIAHNFLQSLSHERGRLLFLSNDNSTLPQDLKYYSSQIPTWEHIQPPYIYVHPSADQALLRFADPHAYFCAELEPKVQAIHGHNEDMQINASPFTTQVWAKGMEACFVHNDLSKAFFQNSILTATSIVHGGI